MENTIVSPLEDCGVFIDEFVFETDWPMSSDADDLSMQLAYDYDVHIPREGAGASEIRFMKHRSGAIGINVEDLIRMHAPSDDEDHTYSPKVSMAIDLYVMYDWRIRNVDYDEDDAPPAYARVHVRGQFSASRDSFASEVTDDEITQWVGMKAIDIMYEKAKRAVEERLSDSGMGWQKLPIINPRGVWENARFEGERNENGAADLLNQMLEDGSFWDDDEEDGELEEDNTAAGAGIWRMNDDGTFELLEPYRTELEEARISSTQAWTLALIAYLEPRCPYTAEELKDELLKRNRERSDSKVPLFEEFVLEALSGEL